MKKLLLATLFLLSSPVGLAGWLPREIREVRAYVYDYTQEERNLSLLKNGKIHKGVINGKGAKLTGEQVEILKAALTSKEKRKPGAFCYMPHHGFIFFDKKGKPMGHVELCYQCGNVASSPKGLPEREWDWVALTKIFKAHQIPFLKDDKAYTKLYESRKGKK